MAKKTDLIAYCGLYCGTCACYTQDAANLAKDLGKELHKHKFAKYADYLAKLPGLGAFENYAEFSELLKVVETLRCKGCETSGPAGCKIRTCARQKRLAGCWECEKMVCGKFDALKKSGDRTYIKNLREIRKSGPAAFVKKQTRQAIK